MRFISICGFLSVLGCGDAPGRLSAWNTPPMVRLEQTYGCALDSRGKVFCWGNQFDYDQHTGHIDPLAHGDDVVVKAPAGEFQFIVLERDCPVVFAEDGESGIDWVCGSDHELANPGAPIWGADVNRLGNHCVLYRTGDVDCRHSAFEPPVQGQWRQVVMGSAGLCLIAEDSSWWCSQGTPSRNSPDGTMQLGTLYDDHPTIHNIGLSPNSAAVCIVTLDRAVACHGFEAHAAVPDVRNAHKVVVDDECVCVLKRTGRVECGCVSDEKNEAMSAVTQKWGIADIDLLDRLCVSYASTGRVECFGGSDDRFGQSSPQHPPR